MHILEVKPYCYKLLIAYDGTRYGGWQVQPNAVTIQFILQQAVQTIIREEPHVVASGRTDTGVHALGQVAHLRTSQPQDPKRLMISLNGLLPADVRILNVEAVPAHFHARYQATGKEYHYHLYLGRALPPFVRLYRWHMLHRVDPERIRQAATYFEGTHDFKTFANEAHRGCASRDSVRTLYHLGVCLEGEELRLEFCGNGFLYKMVRNIVGFLIEVGRGKREIENIPELFRARNRRLIGVAAPPQGLFLVRVDYPDPLPPLKHPLNESSDSNNSSIEE